MQKSNWACPLAARNVIKVICISLLDLRTKVWLKSTKIAIKCNFHWKRIHSDDEVRFHTHSHEINRPIKHIKHIIDQIVKSHKLELVRKCALCKHIHLKYSEQCTERKKYVRTLTHNSYNANWVHIIQLIHTKIYTEYSETLKLKPHNCTCAP